jgi:predicted nucleic acid-binding protein
VIVIDASIALAWGLREREHADVAAALDYVSEHGAYVPGNFQSEVSHALLQAERKKRIGEADVAQILSDILALSLPVELPDPHVVVAAARAHGLTCYEASYLALALQLHLPLATVDATLGAAAKSAKCAWKPQR